MRDSDSVISTIQARSFFRPIITTASVIVETVRRRPLAALLATRSSRSTMPGSVRMIASISRMATFGPESRASSCTANR